MTITPLSLLTLSLRAGIARHGRDRLRPLDAPSVGGRAMTADEPTLAFEPCPDERTFAYLEAMRDARKALAVARASLTLASLGYPRTWAHDLGSPSGMIASLDRVNEDDRTPPTCSAGCLVWGASLGEQDSL